LILSQEPRNFPKKKKSSSKYSSVVKQEVYEFSLLYVFFSEETGLKKFLYIWVFRPKILAKIAQKLFIMSSVKIARNFE